MKFDLTSKALVAEQTQFPSLSDLSVTTEQIQALMSNLPKLEITPNQIYTPDGIKKLEKHAEEVTRVAKLVGIDVSKFAAPHFSDPLSLNSLKSVESEVSNVEQPNSSNVEFNSNELRDALQKDKDRANKIIQDLVKAAKDTKKALLGHMENRPLHPYEQMIYDYLGSSFKPTEVEDIEINPDLNLHHALELLDDLSKRLFDKAMQQTRLIAKQAFDTSFPGITSEALGTAFATLTSTSDGQPDFVVDEQGIKRHLTFVENVRNIPVDYIVANPHEALKKILSEFYRADYCF